MRNIVERMIKILKINKKKCQNLDYQHLPKLHHHASAAIPICTCHCPEAPQTQSSSRESEKLLRECESASRRLLMPMMRPVIVSRVFSKCRVVV